MATTPTTPIQEPKKDVTAPMKDSSKNASTETVKDASKDAAKPAVVDPKSQPEIAKKV